MNYLQAEDIGNKAQGPALGVVRLHPAARSSSVVLPYPNRAGGSYNWYLDIERALFLRSVRKSVDSIQAGYCVGIYRPARGRIAHITRAVELVKPLRKGRAPRAAWCIGGNEGSGTRAGIHRTLYPLSSIHALSNWLYKQKLAR